MYTRFSNMETKTTIKKDQRRTKMEQNTYWYLLGGEFRQPSIHYWDPLIGYQNRLDQKFQFFG